MTTRDVTPAFRYRSLRCVATERSRTKPCDEEEGERSSEDEVSQLLQGNPLQEQIATPGGGEAAIPAIFLFMEEPSA